MYQANIVHKELGDSFFSLVNVNKTENKKNKYRLFFNSRFSNLEFKRYYSKDSTYSGRIKDQKYESWQHLLVLNIIPGSETSECLQLFDMIAFSIGVSGISNFDDLNKRTIKRKNTTFNANGITETEEDEKFLPVYEGEFIQRSAFYCKLELLKIFINNSTKMPVSLYLRQVGDRFGSGITFNAYTKNDKNAFGFYSELSDFGSISNGVLDINVGLRFTASISKFGFPKKD